ncbi:exopolysaccharide transport family protein [Cucumibacter marinus]|uniref:exopolysaccharide transport family protein n=1 Tax=Cucumibacter marinus TaxID=1121252 RepID=UPI00040051DA|nr:exopolysaccharide transport family protein [Cucumibacter marinus]
MSSDQPTSFDDMRIDFPALAMAIWRRKLRIILVTALVCAATYFVLTQIPRSYTATANLLIESRDNSFTRATTDNNGSQSAVADDAAVESQVQLIRSRETLIKVIEAENLDEVAEFVTPDPGPFGIYRLLGRGQQSTKTPDARALDALRQGLVAARERSSRVVSISFTAHNPELAARVANAIATAHVGRRTDLVLSDTGDASNWLEGEIKKLRTRVTDAEREVADFKVNNDLFKGSNDSTLLEQQLSDYSEQITAASERKNTARTKASLIDQLLKAGQPVETIADVRASPVIQQLTEQKAELQSTRAERLATRLPSHPAIKTIDAQIRAVNDEIATEGGRIASAFESEAQVEEDLEQSLRDELTRLKLQASDAEINNVRLAELEREATAQRDLLNAFLIRFREAAARSEANAAFPDVRIVSSAAPPEVPSFPKKGIMLAMAGFGALLIQGGLILLGELSAGHVFVPRERRASAYHGAYRDASAALPRERGEALGAAFAAMRMPPTEDKHMGRDERPASAFTGSEKPAGTREQPVEVVAPSVSTAANTPAESDKSGQGTTVQGATGQGKAEQAVGQEAVAVATKESVSRNPAPTKMAPAPRVAAQPPVLPIDIDAALDELGQRQDRLVLVTAMDDGRADRGLTRALADALVAEGLSVAIIDAGGMDAADRRLGLSDLAADTVEFGDIVHNDAGFELAEIPWGRTPRLNADSPRIPMLVDALGELYDVSIVMCGPVGTAHGLGLFARSGAALVLTGRNEIARDEFDGVKADARASGLGNVLFVSRKPGQDLDRDTRENEGRRAL